MLFNDSVGTAFSWDEATIIYSVAGLYNATCTVFNLADHFVSATVAMIVLNETGGLQTPGETFLPEALKLKLIGAALGVGLAGSLFVSLMFIGRSSP
ncbi:MAG: hypothetical protein ACFFFG_06420 [Candidatus Thorarchaeota archaeon]